MSQRKDAMRIIERDSGLEGLILRPLSAKLLEPTIPEERGLVDRVKLLAIEGRSRKPQIQLASHFGINDYPCPAGGCLLTDSGFTRRMRDLIERKLDFTINDVQLLKLGRHFRLAPQTKLIVGRDEEENNKLLNLAKEEDLWFQPLQVKGPVGIGRGLFSEKYLYTASCIIARYSDKNQDHKRIKIIYGKPHAASHNTIFALPVKEELLKRLRI